MKKKVSIAYFPTGMKYVAPVLIGAGAIVIWISYFFWGTVLILVGLVILTTNYVTEIDLTQKMYRDYLSLLGLKLNSDSGTFKNVERIIISKSNHAQAVRSRIQSRTMKWADFTGTLVFDNDIRLDLITRTDKKLLIKELKEFADFLKVGIEDHTTNQWYWIDLTKY